MDYSQKISERQWNLPEKGELESRREATYIDDIIQKDHIQRKLLEHLDGIRTVFDGGAGSGRFSILLAKRGCQVKHVFFHEYTNLPSKFLSGKRFLPHAGLLFLLSNTGGSGKTAASP